MGGKNGAQEYWPDRVRDFGGAIVDHNVNSVSISIVYCFRSCEGLECVSVFYIYFMGTLSA